MSTRYRKRYHPFPGIHINMSRPYHMASVTLGHPRLLSMTFGGDSHWFNVNLPGDYSWRSGKRGGHDKSHDKHSTKDKQHEPGGATPEETSAETTRHSAKAAILGFLVGAVSFGTPLGMTFLHFALHAA